MAPDSKGSRGSRPAACLFRFHKVEEPLTVLAPGHPSVILLEQQNVEIGQQLPSPQRRIAGDLLVGGIKDARLGRPLVEDKMLLVPVEPVVNYRRAVGFL